MYLCNKERYDELESYAADIIEDYGIASFPINLDSLFEKMKITLVPYSSIINQEAKRIAGKLSEDAFYLTKGKFDLESLTICFNPEQRATRVYTSKAHEFGHIICGHPNDEEPYESEAKYFASYFLAPTVLILEIGCETVDDVMDKFGVGYETARIQLGRAFKRRRYGGSYKDYELRIMETCKYWIGGNRIGKLNWGA